MKAELVYKNEVSGELNGETIEISEEWEAEKIMRELIECIERNRTSIITTLDNKPVKIPVLKWIKEDRRYELFRLVSVWIK